MRSFELNRPDLVISSDQIFRSGIVQGGLLRCDLLDLRFGGRVILHMLRTDWMGDLQANIDPSPWKNK